MDTLETSLLALRFQLFVDVVFLVSRLLTVSVSVRSSFLDDVVGHGKEVHRVLDGFLIFLSSFTQEITARAVDNASVPPSMLCILCIAFWVPSRAIHTI